MLPTHVHVWQEKRNWGRTSVFIARVGPEESYNPGNVFMAGEPWNIGVLKSFPEKISTLVSLKSCPI